jgi:hypothetical protein
MTTEHNSIDADANKRQAVDETTAPTRIEWGTADVVPVEADATHTTAERDAIVLYFGKQQASHAEDEPARVRLSDRIILGRLAAEQLSAALGNAIADYERESATADVRNDSDELSSQSSDS